MLLRGVVIGGSDYSLQLRNMASTGCIINNPPGHNSSCEPVITFSHKLSSCSWHLQHQRLVGYCPLPWHTSIDPPQWRGLQLAFTLRSFVYSIGRVLFGSFPEKGSFSLISKTRLRCIRDRSDCLQIQKPDRQLLFWMSWYWTAVAGGLVTPPHPPYEMNFLFWESLNLLNDP